MKVGYVLLSVVVAVTLMAGPASAQRPICVELAHVGDDVTMTWRDEEGAIAGDYESVELYIAGIGVADVTPGDPGSATFPWDDALETSDFAQLVLQDDGGEETESRIYFAVPYEVDPARIDMGYDTPAEAIEAGGNCEAPVILAPCAKICPPNAAVGEEITMTLLDAEGNPINKQQHLDAGYAWCWFFVMDHRGYPDGINVTEGNIEATMNDAGGVVMTMTQEMKDTLDDAPNTEFSMGVEDPGGFMIGPWLEGIDDGGVATMLTTGLAGLECGDASCAEAEPSPEPVTSGAPVAGMLGLGLAAAACALGGAMTLRKTQFTVR